ncbi:MAG: LysR family transcriptional regulator [Ectothiorhodospiraceae bacterium]|nr:LysR family transcriptional regulator [Ectothiorhodospiraceae bacterium]
MDDLNSAIRRRRLPSLPALRAFEAAARHSSAKRAALELSVTPTAISHQIRQLEEALGISLFLRKPRRLILTSQGRELMVVLGESFDAIAGVINRLRSTAARDTVTVSTTPAVASRWLLPRVCILRESHPQLDLRIHVSHEPVTLDGVTADVAIRYGRGPWPGLASEKLFDNVFIPACSPALKLRRRVDLPRHTLIHCGLPPAGRGPMEWATWQRHARVPGLDVATGLNVSDETLAISAALDGQGIALMSRLLIMDELRSGRLIQPFGPSLDGDPFHLVYPDARADDPRITAIRQWVKRLLEDMCADRGDGSSPMADGAPR